MFTIFIHNFCSQLFYYNFCHHLAFKLLFPTYAGNFDAFFWSQFLFATFVPNFDSNFWLNFGSQLCSIVLLKSQFSRFVKTFFLFHCQHYSVTSIGNSLLMFLIHPATCESFLFAPTNFVSTVEYTSEPEHNLASH